VFVNKVVVDEKCLDRVVVCGYNELKSGLIQGLRGFGFYQNRMIGIV